MSPAGPDDTMHIPVLLDAVLTALAPRDGEVIVDGTFGAGGYSRAILAAADCRVIGIDRDPDAIAAGIKMARTAGGRLTLLAGCYGDMDRLLQDSGVEGIDGVALDIGVSSMQIDQADRGFSFSHDGPLDMRMGRDSAGEPTAADLVNGMEENALADLIFAYGEERHSRRIARAIATARTEAPIATTAALAAIVRSAVPGAKRQDIHPATRTFQALRIAVNDELGELDRGLAAAERLLVPGGRLAVVSFHSLEDRQVKRFLTERSGSVPRRSRHLPDAGPDAPAPTFNLPRRGTIKPEAAEIGRNPRARSARLRVAVRTQAPAWIRPAVDTPTTHRANRHSAARRRGTQGASK